MVMNATLPCRCSVTGAALADAVGAALVGVLAGVLGAALADAVGGVLAGVLIAR
jgi:hypothetical protein